MDVARGVAVLGMATAHVGPEGTWSEPAGWLALADGRSAALFATLAGVSAGLLSAGRPLPAARARLAARAALIGALGLVLMALGTPVVVILPSYAVMFVLLVPALGANARADAVAAAVVLAAGTVVHTAAAGTPWAEQWPSSVLVGRYYPVVVWTAYLLAGLAVQRAGLLSRPGRLAVIGLGLAGLGYGTGALAALAGAGGALVDLTPHSSSPVEVTGNLGAALLVLAGGLGLGRRRWLAPLAATGALALTAYSAQVVAIAVLGPRTVFEPTTATWLTFCLVTLAGCWAWRTWLGRGPLERLVHAGSVAAAAGLVGPAGRD